MPQIVWEGISLLCGKSCLYTYVSILLHLQTEGEGLRAALEQAEERAPPPPAHALKHELQHSQPVSFFYLVRKKMLYMVLYIHIISIDVSIKS